jgi:probable phosphoglycerate mutase
VLLLLRHGETPHTAEHRFSGSADSAVPLSPRGRRQAEQAAQAPQLADVTAIVSSPQTRCTQTAEAAAAALDLPVQTAEGLRETNFGAWEGLTFAEAQARYPAELTAWLASPTAAPPGGESFAHVTARVRRTRDALLAAHPARTVLLVTHATPVRTLLRLALQAPPRALFLIEAAPASLSAVAYYADGTASVRYANSTAHLA